MHDLETLKSLSKIKLSEKENSAAEEYFKYWIFKFDMLDEVGTNGIEPLVSVLPLENVMREDISRKMATLDELLENSPEQHEGYFVVPRVLD
ncbi:MAG: Asp-tRNA(Asn)/Glu-tRNA(Gln) amidotransferase subunit GatC [Oscillospiraceae bacterium]|jgi:aspartyl-tRNA(Asn)/glutamyl-tRNA(Gln) amidotransferase subunit C|nr:Asp-tRNA(Asn)/Glu-tRNA(Gln) amidotransferase subunit GatC [Oscillospiraceae bacterium]